LTDCPFCTEPEEYQFAFYDYAYARFDAYPVNPGHILVCPKRHVSSWSELTGQEKADLLELVECVRINLDRDLKPDGYNVGFNDGKAAGQTIMHFHIHVIPRFEGDTEEPAGGIRGCIPNRMKYSNDLFSK
jgi:diadenosine tetraphosphate (Ap4A) HIT family hydrolase